MARHTWQTWQTWSPSWVDLETPNAARVYDYYLGGSHNFEADRRMARQAMEQWPDLPAIMRANRAFLRRAVHYLAGQGFTRFLDIGSGIPTLGAVHEVARELQPQARVVYVDRDPVAVAHSQMMLAEDPLSNIVQADLTEPEELLAHPDVVALLDAAEPVALLLIAVLHFVPDRLHPHDLVARLREALPPGSALALCHACVEGRPDQVGPHQDIYARTRTPLTMRDHDQIARFFDGFTLVDPGLVYLTQWRPDRPDSVGPHPERLPGLVGVGLLP
ncbi:SAM-dependent methyltransferase [Streptacidiphilus jiangxiensis]|uniref:S-adenosyl methyltransferase n=1 Tax=Streptacidiphilus jiangxiensis TaxID=235985 RepID=A0A1H7T7E5_STRJI|nr:SAM-dependent methyltransferase [Streptacidiphilus jiangxiensis]SEL80781.1 S-adenosyl methyltransferase [Streptacidiphilus jiangxiensis]